MQKLLEQAIIKRKDAGQGQSTNNWCYKRDMSRELFRFFPCSRAVVVSHFILQNTGIFGPDYPTGEISEKQNSATIYIIFASLFMPSKTLGFGAKPQ